MDRAYLGFERLYHMHECLCYFVIREKHNFKYKRVYSNEVNKDLGFKCDQIIKLTGFYTTQKYLEKLRRIKFYDVDRDKTLVFITNNFVYSAEIIAQLYTQIWIAISIYLQVAIMKRKLKLKQELYTILQILSVCIFEKVPINQLFENNKYKDKTTESYNQLNLFDL